MAAVYKITYNDDKFIYYEGELKDNKFDKDIDKNIRYGHGKMKYANGNIYEGEWKNNNKSGNGKMKYQNGSIYDGEWKKNKKNGKGKMIYGIGHYYEGEWKNDMKDGKGIYRTPDGVIYEGEWKDDKKNGNGKIKYGMGHYYDGEWKDNMKNGKGIYRKCDGEIYNGEWKDEQKHGYGKLYVIYSNDILYEGQWEYDNRNGYGKGRYKKMVFDGKWENGIPDICDDTEKEIIFNNGSIYNGNCEIGVENMNMNICTNNDLTIKHKNFEVKINERNIHLVGYGKIKYANGDTYEGNWDKSLRNGKGKYVFMNGDIYDGMWLDNIRNGQGKMKYINGDKYEGEWKNNKKFSNGKMSYSNGDIYKGSWYADMKNGQGKMIYSNGDIYKGLWFADMKNGQGKMIYSNGEIYEGEWKDNNYKKGKLISMNGEIYDGDWKNGKKHGSGILIFDDYEYNGEFKDNFILSAKIKSKDGALINCYNFINNVSCGYATIEYSNNDIYEGDIFQNLPNGYGAYINSDGLVDVGMWKDGKKDVISKIKFKQCTVCTKYYEPHHFNVACGKCNNYLCKECYKKNYNHINIEKGEIFPKNKYLCPFCREIQLYINIDDNLREFIKNCKTNRIGKCKKCSNYDEYDEECGENHNLENNINLMFGFVCKKCVRDSVKKCPQCNYYIEKNGGCNHMTCRCGYHFCWICLKAWAGHSSYYACNIIY
jgi:hypothetical protein